MRGYEEKLEEIMKMKMEIRKIKNKISKTEDDLLSALIQDGRHDLLQINYGRLHQVTKVAPLRYRSW